MEPGGWTHATWVAIKVTMCRSCRDSEIMFARKETDDDHEAIGGGGVGGAMGRMSTLGVVPGNDGIRRARDAIEQFFYLRRSTQVFDSSESRCCCFCPFKTKLGDWESFRQLN